MMPTLCVHVSKHDGGFMPRKVHNKSGRRKQNVNIYVAQVINAFRNTRGRAKNKPRATQRRSRCNQEPAWIPIRRHMKSFGSCVEVPEKNGHNLHTCKNNLGKLRTRAEQVWNKFEGNKHQVSNL